MSCATLECYRGQFSLKLCQVTVIVKRHSKSSGICLRYTARKTTASGISLSQAASHYHCIPVCYGPCPSETGSQAASSPQCRWGWPSHADPSASASTVMGFWVSATRHTSCQLFLMTCAKLSQICYHFTSMFKSNSALFWWLNFKIQCDFLMVATPHPRIFVIF